MIGIIAAPKPCNCRVIFAIMLGFFYGAAVPALPNSTISLQPRPSLPRLLYDGLMMVLIVVDLLAMLADSVATSALVNYFAPDFAASYAPIHANLLLIGGVFTAFLVAELLVRWLLSVSKKRYERWFFFPFVHWYEVLGCFPLLRPLRLLRVVVMVRRLHALGVAILPKRWLAAATHYGHMVLEALSDKVILTALANLKVQLAASNTHKGLIYAIIDANREGFYRALSALLQREFAPVLAHAVHNVRASAMPEFVGQQIAFAMKNNKELSKYLKLIPIAGSLIEGKLGQIGQELGENLTRALLNEAEVAAQNPTVLNALLDATARKIAYIDMRTDALEAFASKALSDALAAFELQIRAEQNRHLDELATLLPADNPIIGHLAKEEDGLEKY